MSTIRKEILDGDMMFAAAWEEIDGDGELIAKIADIAGLKPQLSADKRMVFLEDSAGRDSSDNVWNPLDVYNSGDWTPLYSWLSSVGEVKHEHDPLGSFSLSLCLWHDVELEDGSTFTVVIRDHAKARPFVKLLVLSMCRLILLIDGVKQEKKQAMERLRQGHSICNLGDLRKALACIEDLPDDTMLVHQVVGEESGAWNMGLDFVPCLKGMNKPYFQMKHPRLKNLPMSDERWEGSE